MEICNDPLPANRVVVGKKYDAKFQEMKPGQCLKVPTKQVGRVTNSLRKWISTCGRTLHVRSVAHYPGDLGMGRVWLMDGEIAK